MPRVFYSNFVKGANTAVSPFVQQDNSLYVQNGVNSSYKIGAMYKDLGYSRVANAAVRAGKSVLGAFDFRQEPGTQKFLATVNDSGDSDTELWYNNAGTWAEIPAAETAWAGVANCNVEMESFIGYCFFVGHNGSSFLPVGSLTGTTFSTSTNVTSMPQGKFIIRYRDRLYVLNARESATNYPYRMYSSSIPSAGSITWTNTDFEDFDYSEEITGCGVNWDMLVVFTKFRAFFYNQDQKKQLWEIGCANHRSIKSYGPYMFFANNDGVWVSQGGGFPENISGEIIDFVRNANPDNFFAEIVDEEYHLYVGSSVTVNGVAYSNVKLTYNIPTDSWRWRELYDDLTIFAKFHNGTTGQDRLYMGDTGGFIWDKSKYTDSTLAYSDSELTLGTVVNPIHSSMETKPFFMGDPRAIKRLKSISVYAERAQNVMVKYRVLDNNTRGVTPYLPIGTLNQYINNFEGSNTEFNMIQFEFTEYSTNPYFSIFGMELDYEVAGDSLNIK